jgi:TatA/E family protein of Tat protein translocase
MIRLGYQAGQSLFVVYHELDGASRRDYERFCLPGQLPAAGIICVDPKRHCALVMLSLPHLVVLFLIALVVFGPQKLPELARMLGKATAEFRKMTNDFRFALEDEVRELERQTRIREEEVKAAALAAAAPVPTPAPSPDGTVAREQTNDVVSAPAEPVLVSAEARGSGDCPTREFF